VGVSSSKFSPNFLRGSVESRSRGVHVAPQRMRNPGISRLWNNNGGPKSSSPPRPPQARRSLRRRPQGIQPTEALQRGGPGGHILEESQRVLTAATALICLRDRSRLHTCPQAPPGPRYPRSPPSVGGCFLLNKTSGWVWVCFGTGTIGTKIRPYSLCVTSNW